MPNGRIFLTLFLLGYGALCAVPTPTSAQDGMKINAIRFVGNDHLSDKLLKKVLRNQEPSFFTRLLPWKKPPRFSQHRLQRDLRFLELLYQQQGYPDARVVNYRLEVDERRQEVTLIFYINEGLPAVVRQKIYVLSDTAAGDVKELMQEIWPRLPLKPGMILKAGILTEEKKLIADFFSNHAYPYIQTRIKVVMDDQTNEVWLTYYVEPGRRCSFGPITFVGNTQVSDEVLRGALGFETGKRFKQSKLAEAQRAIYRLELFDYVSVRRGETKNMEKNIPIIVEVKERPSRSLKLGLGAETDGGFRASLNLRHRNVFGGARKLDLFAKSARYEQLAVNLQFNQPFLFGSRNDYLLKGFYRRQDEAAFNAQRLGLENLFGRQFGRYSSMFFSYRIERVRIEIREQVRLEELPDFTKNAYNKAIFQFGVTRNSTNDPLSPTSGMISSLTFQDAGALLFSELRYYKIVFEVRRYQTIKSGRVLAGRLLLGAMQPRAGGRLIPLEERFYLGGSNSVRGWGRRKLGPVDEEGTPVGGRALAALNLELRYPVWKNLRAVSFVDAGNVWRETKDIFRQPELFVSPGMGLRYRTPIGPLRFDVAYRLRRQPSDPSTGGLLRHLEFHVSIGQAF
jgi:outer membrane protein insertion porin family